MGMEHLKLLFTKNITLWVLGILAAVCLTGAVASSLLGKDHTEEKTRKTEQEDLMVSMMITRSNSVTAVLKEAMGNLQNSLDVDPEVLEAGATQEQDGEDEYADLAVARVDHYVNVRSGPDTEHEILGKMYDGSVAEILEYVEGEDGLWFRILSGNVEGYIKAEYFLYGEELLSRIDDFLLHRAVVQVTRLNVRSEADVTSARIGYADAGEKLRILQDLGDWLQVEYGEKTGYVAAEYVSVEEDYITAKTLEEEAAELAILKNRQEKDPAETSASQDTVSAGNRQTEGALQEQTGGEDNGTGEMAGADQTGTDQTGQDQTAEDLTAVTADNGSYLTHTELRNAIIQYALQYVGYPYVHGGQSLAGGTDCSGFTSYVYREFGYSLSRTPSGQYKGNGRSVSLAEAQPGDIICYGSGSCTHVALYIGNGQIVHEANKQKGCIVSSIDFMIILGVKNVID